ncbi:MAG TPA: DUF6152 family protein [Azospirillum sp.]|nr:DUF6152 family protein [Azospirillum sp.]
MRRGTLIVTAGLCAAALPAAAHHGWSSYDAGNVVVLEAPVVASSYQNPHGEVQVEAKGKRWAVVLAPPSRMERRGLSREDIAVGKVVRVEGYPSRVHDGEMRAERISVDGRTIELR